MKPVKIIKASGDQAVFSPGRLRKSLHRAGASNETVNAIVNEVEKQLFDGMTTKAIYQLAFSLLKKYSKPIAAKYKLKRAIMELGPSGFPFEKYVAEILKYQGFRVKVGEIVKGSCVNHEIDVIAEKDHQKFMIECKFHNSPGINCNVKIPLYIQARFKDVEKQWLLIPGSGTKFHQGWLVTNTRFTDDALQYGVCAGLHLISWDFPKRGSLREEIDSSGLYPITCLTSLTASEKQLLLGKEIVLVKELYDNEMILRDVNISSERVDSILKEAEALSR